MHKTPLNAEHRAAGAKMVDFVGWELPIHYGSQIDEHRQVRAAAGMFDVSHMTVVDVRGREARAFLSRLLANDVARLKQPGKALYSCMLTEDGGVIDDLIAYFMNEQWFRMVVNAATRDKGLAWLERHSTDFSVAVTEHHELAIIAVQGPEARARVHDLLPASIRTQAEGLAPFSAAWDSIFFNHHWPGA